MKEQKRLQELLPKVIIIQENFWCSVISDAMTFGCLFLFSGLALWADSVVLSIVAVVLWGVTMPFVLPRVTDALGLTRSKVEVCKTWAHASNVVLQGALGELTEELREAKAQGKIGGLPMIRPQEHHGLCRCGDPRCPGSVYSSEALDVMRRL